MNEDTMTPQTTTRERFTNIVRRKLGEQGLDGDTLEAKLQEIISKVDWSKVAQPE